MKSSILQQVRSEARADADRQLYVAHYDDGFLDGQDYGYEQSKSENRVANAIFFVFGAFLSSLFWYFGILT